MPRVMLEFVDLCLLQNFCSNHCAILQDMFALYDADEDGFLSKQEVIQYAQGKRWQECVKIVLLLCGQCFHMFFMCFHVYVKEQWQGMAREFLFARFCAGEFEFSPPESCMAAWLKV